MNRRLTGNKPFDLKKLLTPRKLVSMTTLTAGWCILWRDLSIANLLAGATIAVVLTATGVGTLGRGGVRPIPLAKLFWLVLVDLTKATYGVAKDAMLPGDSTSESIIGIDLPPMGEEHLLLLIVAITVTPGTAVVDADPDTGLLYVHVLYDDWRDDTVTHVEKLARLAEEALPTYRPEPVSTGGKP